MSEINFNGGNQNIINNGNDSYIDSKEHLLAEVNGLNDVIDIDNIEGEHKEEEPLNPPQVVNELVDVPVLSDALVSKNKALKIFKSPLETHDSFDRTLNRKHKFNFFEKILCVVTFGLASKLINHLNKSNDRREAMELKENTLSISLALTHFPKDEPNSSIGVDLFNNGRPIHAVLERNEKDQLFIRLPGLEQKIRLPYDLEQMRTLISTDICSHIDIFGIDSALLSLDAEQNDISRRGMLTSILSHMTGGEKKYHELSIMDQNTLETVVENLRNNSQTLRESGQTDEQITQNNKTYLENELRRVESKYQLISTKLNNSLVQKEALYSESIAKIEDQMYETSLKKLTLDLSAQNTSKTELENKIKQKQSELESYDKKQDLSPEDLHGRGKLGFEIENLSKSLSTVSEKIADIEKKIADLNKEHDDLVAQRNLEVQQNPAPQDNQALEVGEAGKQSPKINTLYVDSIIEKLEAEKKESPQSVEQKVDTSVISKGTDNKFISKTQDLQTKIELIKGANEKNVKKYVDGINSMKGDAENSLKSFYTADSLAKKIIDLSRSFNENHNLKTEYDAKVSKLNAEIDKLKTSQDPNAQETLENLNTELNNLKKNPTYLSDEQLIKNMVLENKEVFASINAEIKKLKQENNSYDESMAFKNSSIGKIINTDVGDIVYSLCREIGFDNVTARDIDNALTSFDMANNIKSFFSFFLGSEEPVSEDKKAKDPFLAKVSRIPQEIANLDTVKTQNLIEEITLLLKDNKLDYERFKQLKQKYVTIMFNFEKDDTRNAITEGVPENIRKLLVKLNSITTDNGFDAAISNYKKAEEFNALVQEIDAYKGKGLTADSVLNGIISKSAMSSLTVGEDKPLFKLFKQLVKSGNYKDVQKSIQNLRPFMSKENYDVIWSLGGVLTSFLNTDYIKGELNKNPDTDLSALFKKMVETCLYSKLESPIASVEARLEREIANEELRNKKRDFLDNPENACMDKMCKAFSRLFATIEKRDVINGFKEIEALSANGSLDENSMKTVIESHPALLVGGMHGYFYDDLSPSQVYLGRQLYLAFSPLAMVLRQTYTSGHSNETLNDAQLRELADKLLFTTDHDPITFDEKVYNPVSSEMRNMLSDGIYTAVRTIPKLVTSVRVGANNAIGSATLSTQGAFDYKSALNKVAEDLEKVKALQNDFFSTELDLVTKFGNQQKELLAQQRAFWVHNFLADLIFEEDGSDFDKSLDKLESNEGALLVPGEKIQRLINKHAKALAYMIKDPLALNTLPSIIKSNVQELLSQIKKSGLNILVDKNNDSFTDAQLESSANLIRSLINVDLNKPNSELTPVQLQIKLGLVNAEKSLETSIDSILESVSISINDQNEEDIPVNKIHEAPVQANNAPVNEADELADNIVIDGEDEENPPVDNGDMSDPLNPNSTLKSLDAASGNKDDVMTQFVTNVRKSYFNKLSKMDKLSMVSASIRYSRADKKGFIDNEKLLGAAFKGAGPIMQKMLQKTPQKDISDELKKSFSDMKSNLAPIPENVVKAHLLEIVNSSNGKINKIEIQRSLGAASVGEAFLCKIYTADKPEGVDCVVKILRPDVMNKAHRELEIFRDAAKDIPGMDVTFEGSLKTIMEELDLTNEAQNIISGQIYNNFDPNVQSMKLFDQVPPSTDVLIIEKAPGVTVNCVINSLEDKIINDILKPVTHLDSKIPGVDFGSNFDDIDDFVRNSQSLTPSDEELLDMQGKVLNEYKNLIVQRNNLVKFSKEWVSQGIFGTGFYHGDLHSGNIMTSTDKLTVIDFGNCIKLKPYQQENIIRMMAASIDSNGPAFMQGLKSLLSQTSLDRLAEVKEYNGVQKTVEQHLTEVLSAILKKGGQEDTGLRIKLAMEAILKEGIEIPAPIYNFELCQLSLQNTIDDMNDQIDTIRKVFLKLGQSVNDMHHAYICPTASFASQASSAISGIKDYKEAMKTLNKIYNDEVDNLLKDPNDRLRRRTQEAGKEVTSLNIDEQDSNIKASFKFMDDPKYKELFDNWQTNLQENERKEKAGEEVSLNDKNAENEAFEAFFSYYKEKELLLMHKEYETLKSFLEERNKKEESFLTGMTEVLKTYQWDAVKMLGTLTTIKYGIKNIFA